MELYLWVSPQVEEPYDPERCLDYPLQLDLDLDRDLGDEESFDVEDCKILTAFPLVLVLQKPSFSVYNAAFVCLVYPVDEGPVFAMCMTSQGDQATLNQWISGLQGNNPILGQVPTLFRLDDGPRELQWSADTESGHPHRPKPEAQKEDSQPVEETEFVEGELRRSQGMKQWMTVGLCGKDWQENHDILCGADSEAIVQAVKAPD